MTACLSGIVASFFVFPSDESLLSQKRHFTAKEDSLPIEAEHGTPTSEVGVLKVDKFTLRARKSVADTSIK